MNTPIPPHLRPADYTTKLGEQKEIVLEVLRKSLLPMTRLEIEEALNWPANSLSHSRNKSMDPIMHLMEEGKVGRLREGTTRRYYADPDISKLIVKP